MFIRGVGWHPPFQNNLQPLDYELILRQVLVVIPGPSTNSEKQI